MIKIYKLFLISMAVLLGAGIGIASFAEETTEETANVDVVQETQVSAQDLEVSNPTLLPSSPFYFLKEWTRSARMAFTFSEIKKTELENKFTNEKLIELKKMTEAGANSKKIKKATENYQKAMDKTKERADKIKERASNNETVNRFLEKFTNQQILQEKILQKIEGQVPEEVYQKIKEAREQHIEKFGQVMQKLEDNQEKIKERIENALQNGDEINPEILNKIKERMPEGIKEKLESAKESVREKVNNRLIENATEKNAKKECPLILKPAIDFCKNGIIKVERDKKGCATSFNCLIPSEQKVCTQEYSPVCGEDKKTYSNACIAKNSNAEIAYKGKCKEEKNDEKDVEEDTEEDGEEDTEEDDEKENKECKKLWWFDNKNRACQQKEFCGAFMYSGLRIFDELEECKKNLNRTNSLTPETER